jgi:glycosyltransferase involved in cell wall biosynthesis
MVSVIIPIFNKEQYLEYCIKSILNQTYKDIQIIIINDASTDRSMSIINDLLGTDSRRLIINFETNRGAAQARNAGLDNATGKYVCFVDADDWIEENALEIAVSNIERLGADILQFGNNSIDDKGVYLKHSEQVHQTTDKTLILYELATTKITYLVWNKLYHLEFLKNNHIRFIDNKHEDCIFVSDCVFHLNKIAYIPDILYNYRHCSNSLSTQDVNRDYLDSYFFILDHLDQSNNTLPILDENIDLKNLLLKKYLLWVLELFIRKRPQGSNKKINQLEIYNAINKYFPENAMIIFSLIDIIVNDFKQKENLNFYASVLTLTKKQLIDKFLKSKDERILIYGTSRIAKHLYCVLNWFGYKTIGFIDSKEVDNCKTIFKIQVIPANEIKETNFTRIIAASEKNAELCEILDGLSYKKDEDYMSFELEA